MGALRCPRGDWRTSSELMTCSGHSHSEEEGTPTSFDFQQEGGATLQSSELVIGIFQVFHLFPVDLNKNVPFGDSSLVGNGVWFNSHDLDTLLLRIEIQGLFSVSSELASIDADSIKA